MQLPRPRFRVRRLMVAVAVMAVVFGLWKRREQFLERARYYADALSMPCSLPPPETEADAFRRWEKDQEYQRKRIEYFHKLRLKYEHAARFPFFPVEADPPQPE